MKDGRDKDNFIYGIFTKTSAMSTPQYQLVSSPKNAEVAQSLRDAVTARKAAEAAAAAEAQAQKEQPSTEKDVYKRQDAYYDGKAEQMTDYEWDALFDRLKKLEEETGIVLEDSPTMKVSSDHTAGQKEAHEFLALSLAKTKKPEEVEKWAEGKPIWISWKLDGLTLVVTYDNGKLSKVVTRGDGHIGTNITHLSTAIHGICLLYTSYLMMC